MDALGAWSKGWAPRQHSRDRPGSHRTRAECAKLVPRLLKAIAQLPDCGLAQLVQFGETLFVWRTEIALMWRFTRSNGVTEGFHNKMELINRRAYGFRNFQNYRMRLGV